MRGRTRTPGPLVERVDETAQRSDGAPDDREELAL